jgi:hypothetical protein
MESPTPDVGEPFRPDWKQAQEVYKRRMPHNGKGTPLSVFTECKGLLRLGRRSMLYLYWIQFTIVFMFIASCVEIAHTYFYYKAETSNNIFYRLSMANWSPVADGSSAQTVTLAVLEGVLLIAIIAYIRGYIYFQKKINNASSHTFISISDFSIHVRNVPKGEVQHGTRRLHRFFSQFGNVVNVNMALDSGNVNKLKKTRNKLSKELIHTHVRAAQTFLLRPYYRVRYWIARFRMSRIELEIEKKIAQTIFKCTGDAFITFDTERARFACLHLFNRPYVTRCCQQVKFGGRNDKKKVIFRIDDSKEPADVIWENFEVCNKVN